MLNNEKIILMTKLALYEQGEGKKKIPVGKYFKSDYVGIKMVTSFIYINIAYIICVLLWFATKASRIMKTVNNTNLLSTGAVLIIAYIVGVVLYLFVSYIYFTYKFKSIRRSLKEYNTKLKELNKIQEKEIETLMNDADIEIEAGGREE